MENDAIRYNVPPQFKVGDVVRLRSGSLEMTVYDLYISYNQFDGIYDLQYMDRIKVYSVDGSAVESSKIVYLRESQNVLELVPANITV